MVKLGERVMYLSIYLAVYLPYIHPYTWKHVDRCGSLRRSLRLHQPKGGSQSKKAELGYQCQASTVLQLQKANSMPFWTWFVSGCYLVSAQVALRDDQSTGPLEIGAV